MPKIKDDDIRPFQVSWEPQAVGRVLELVRTRRLPKTPEGGGWRYGCDPEFLERLRARWLDGYDVDAAVAELNRFPQVMVRVEDLDIHAIHVVGEAGGKRPLLLVHGWPGSVYEFWRAIEPLAFPSRHGGKAEDAFDLVIPSLPGFGFSGKPDKPIGIRTTARLFDQLMRKAFGYKTYLVQGGDWGAGVAAWMALEHRKSVRGIHLNYLLVQPAGKPKTATEKAWRAALQRTEEELGAYARLQSSKPSSLAYAMQDNPLAQAAWIVERFHDWADLREGGLETVFGLDRILTDIMIYVMNDAFTTGAWYYAGAREEGVRAMPRGKRVRVPTGFALYPDPRQIGPPMSWVERGYDLVRWSEPPRGGHFAAMEVPDLFVEDVRAWAALV